MLSLTIIVNLTKLDCPPIVDESNRLINLETLINSNYIMVCLDVLDFSRERATIAKIQAQVS